MKIIKSLLLFIVFLNLCILITAKSNLKYSSRQSILEKGKEAFAYNDGRVAQGETFGLGSNGGNSLSGKALENYVKPPYVDHLTFDRSEELSTKINADEIKSIGNYYDGEIGLNKQDISCVIYKDVKSCLLQSHCGWCNGPNKCVLGNSLGPIDNCPKANYQFSSPYNGATVAKRQTNIDLPDMLIKTEQRN